MNRVFAYFLAVLVFYIILRQSAFYTQSVKSIHDTFDTKQKLDFELKVAQLLGKLQKKGLDVQEELGRLSFAASIVKSVGQFASSFR